MASPHSGQVDKFGAAIFWWVRRLSRFDFDFFRFGTAISNLLTNYIFYIFEFKRLNLEVRN